MTSRHPHNPKHATPFRRAAKTVESWVLSDLGRLSMTPRTPASPKSPSISSTSTSSIPHITTTNSPPVWSSSSPAPSFPRSAFPAPLYAPPATPRRLSDWTPDEVDLMSRSRQLSTASTASTASTSSFISTASSTEDPDELPGYDAFLRQQEGRIKSFPSEDREVFQSMREAEGSDCGDEEEGPRWG